MEAATSAGGDDNPPPPLPQKTPESGNGDRPKRKMKTPYQLQVLEETYAVDTYPSEAMREEVSAKIGLSDRQLQMWFCHRRLKDRKFPLAKRAKTEEEVPMPPPLLPAQHAVPTSEIAMAISSTSSPFLGSGEARRAAVRAGPTVSRMVAEVGTGRRYYESSMPPMPPPSPQLSVAELRVIASVEAQLGEPLREDGPIIGVEFEPLPPGAFGAPIAITPHQKHPLRPYNTNLHERHEPKAVKPSTFMPGMEHNYANSSSSGKRKPVAGSSHVVHPPAGSRALHEYQFLPEQPNFRSEAHERQPHSHFYDPAVVTSNTRVSSLPAGEQYLHENEQLSPTYTIQGQLSSTSIPSQQGRQQFFSSSPADYENSSHSKSVTNSATDAQFGVLQDLGSENAYLSSDRRIFQDDDPSRVERKRKSEEARIQKEVEAHEKRIRKELEKQDILRRKREENMRREMERNDRERKKEEERVLREKQREEERFLREQKRENERRERFLQKETRKVDKMRQKEEQRREKEAARLKAANERATARKIAREYTDLIEDERMELMEVAAASKGLSSITALDSETLQQLDMFRDMLSAFPPKSVQLKRPFAILPWAKSEENVANFLMVWKFLITFIDVLGLWSFTIDEFLQSLHDYDSKLLGEIHVSLLKLIIKDIEDVTRTPAIVFGSTPGGGHPQIIEGAYAWGFDIRSWQHHLNFLTWPEILRQLALSAGFGPKLKKRTIERPYLRDENEGNNGVDVISTLRNGAAAENAVALMHEKGYSHRRRSRHRLTPGTVKFAAYHILSLEGCKGLTILEVAEKIQKSGLRDLTTSKTPEASIAAALSRDTKLFERTAPSTYCVRSPFRKDPADANSILSSALEKIQVFQNVLSDSEEAEKDADDADDAERDEDSDCDGMDDPEVDVGTHAIVNKNPVGSKESKDSKPSISLENEKFVVLRNEFGAIPHTSLMKADGGSSACSSGKSNLVSGFGAPQLIDIGPRSQKTSNADVEGTEIDESNFGESWVQGLTEGDYSDLNVEERLNALVALIGVAIEGNSVRVILEERLEAANALKKQMWAEAQLDKRRFKEEYTSKVQHSSYMGSKAENSLTNIATEGSQTPPEIIKTKDRDGNPVAVSNERFLDLQCQNNVSNMSVEMNISGHDLSTNPDPASLPQYGYAAEKSKSQLKSYIGHQAEQHYVYRSLPLGQDRRRNRYWLFSTSTSPNEPDSGRIFLESKDGLWRLIDTEEAFDTLLVALDTRGVRESHLHSMLQRIESTFKEAIRRHKKHSSPVNPDGCRVKAEKWTYDMASSPDGSARNSVSFKIEHGRNEMERNAASKRYKVFLKWMWKECYNSSSILRAMKYDKKRCSELLQSCNICYHCYYSEERHCPSCHKTFRPMYNMDAKFSEHVAHCELKHKFDPDLICEVPASMPPIGIQLLKAQLSLIEASIPAEALQPFWTEGCRKSWGMKLHSSISSEDLLQLVTLLEGAVKRDFLSSSFGTTNELLGPGTGNNAVLPWVPASTSAVALRLLDFDASFSYELECNKDKEDNVMSLQKLPTSFTVKNMLELDPSETKNKLNTKGK